jgi:hypothetical protein
MTATTSQERQHAKPRRTGEANTQKEKGRPGMNKLRQEDRSG